MPGVNPGVAFICIFTVDKLFNTAGKVAKPQNISGYYFPRKTLLGVTEVFINFLDIWTLELGTEVFLYFSRNAANEMDRLCSTKSDVTFLSKPSKIQMPFSLSYCIFGSSN
jgi:hypothetical protein